MNDEKAPKPPKRSASVSASRSGFTAEERSAMKARAKELKISQSKAEAAAAVRAVIAELPPGDRAIAERIDALVSEHAPELSGKLWYGMPAYADHSGKVVCFVQPSAKFDTRYTTFGFNDTASLDDGEMWAASFAIVELTPRAETTLAALIRRSVGSPTEQSEGEQSELDIGNIRL